MIKEVYLVGGAPRTGKTTLAKMIANRLDATYLSLDDLRIFIKELRPENSPEDLYYDDDLEIEEYYAKFIEPKDVFEAERKQNEAVEQYVETLIENFYDWKAIVLEGIGVTPELITKLKDKYSAKGFVTVVENPNIIKSRIYSNGLWDNEEAYPDIYKEKENIWANMYNDWFKQESLQYNVCTIITDTEDLDRLLNEAMSLL